MKGRPIDDGRDTDEIVTDDLRGTEDLLSSDPDLARFEKPRRKWIVPAIVTALFVFVVVPVLVCVGIGWTVAGWLQAPEEVAVREEPVEATAPKPVPAPPPLTPTVVEPEVAAIPSEPPVVPEPVVAPTPVVAAPAPVVPAPAPVVPAPVTPVVPKVPAPNVPRVESLSVTAEGASRLTVKCDPVVKTGATSVQLASFPAGFCSIEAQWGAESYRMGKTVEQPTSLQCALVDGVLRCD